MKKIIKKRIVKISEKDNEGKDEIYTDFYRCPNCDNGTVMFINKFCSQCGSKFKWE